MSNNNLRHDESFVVTNVVGGLTVQEIAELPHSERIRHLRTHISNEWGRLESDKRRIYKVGIETKTKSRTIQVRAFDEIDLREYLKEKFGNFVTYHIFEESEPCS